MSTWKEMGFQKNIEYGYDSFTPEQLLFIKMHKWAGFSKGDSITFTETDEDERMWHDKMAIKHAEWLKKHTKCNPTFDCPLGHNKLEQYGD